MSNSIKLEGGAAFLAALKKAAKEYPGALSRALYTEGFAIQAEAQRKAPVEFGALRTSAYTAPPKGPDSVVEVGFGTKYAVYQHEKTNLRHPRGGQAKYLQAAVNERAPELLGNLAARTSSNIANGLTSEAIPLLGPTRPRPDNSGRRAHRKSRIEERRKADRQRQAQAAAEARAVETQTRRSAKAAERAGAREAIQRSRDVSKDRREKQKFEAWAEKRQQKISDGYKSLAERYGKKKKDD